MQEQLAASESSLKESAAKSLELETTHASLISDLKAKESEKASIQADQEKKAQEIQTLSQAIGTVNNQLAAKVRLNTVSFDRNWLYSAKMIDRRSYKM